jgi:hypothetical protein
MGIILLDISSNIILIKFGSYSACTEESGGIERLVRAQHAQDAQFGNLLIDG